MIGDEDLSIIELSHISKSFEQDDRQVHALNDVSLNIEKGDIYGIIGMSGAGKSTLVRCINYLERPTKGKVTVDGHNLDELSEKELRGLRADIGMIFQHFNLLMQKNILNNVLFPLQLQGVKKSAAVKRARELLQIVGLAEKEKAYPAQLSGGQKQRAAIARALALNPKILLCDEATSALDPQTTASILELLKKINKELGITIVIITHQMSVVRSICNRVAILEKGTLVENGSVEEIFTHPKSASARELISKDVSDLPSDTEKSDYRTILAADERNTGLRVIFSENASSEPVIANLILEFKIPVSILKANTRSIGGKAQGDMILSIPKAHKTKIKEYLENHGLETEEVTV